MHSIGLFIYPVKFAFFSRERRIRRNKVAREDTTLSGTNLRPATPRLQRPRHHPILPPYIDFILGEINHLLGRAKETLSDKEIYRQHLALLSTYHLPTLLNPKGHYKKMTVDIAKVLAMVESSHRMLSENLHILRGQTLALQRNRVAKSRISKQCQGNKSVSRKRTCRGPLPRQQYKILSKDKTIQVALSRINVDYYSSTSSRLPTISSRSLSSSTLSSEVKGGTRRSLRVGRRRQEHNDRRGRQRSGCNNNNEGSLNNGAKPHLHLRYYASCGHQVSYAVTSSTSEDSYGMCVCATPPNYNTFRFRSGGGEMGYYHGEQHQQTGPVLQPRNENANSIYDNVGGGEFSGFYGSMATREVRYRQNREEYDGFCESCDTVTP